MTRVNFWLNSLEWVNSDLQPYTAPRLNVWKRQMKYYVFSTTEYEISHEAQDTREVGLNVKFVAGSRDHVRSRLRFTQMLFHAELCVESLILQNVGSWRNDKNCPCPRAWLEILRTTIPHRIPKGYSENVPCKTRGFRIDDWILSISWYPSTFACLLHQFVTGMLENRNSRRCYGRSRSFV